MFVQSIVDQGFAGLLAKERFHGRSVLRAAAGFRAWLRRRSLPLCALPDCFGTSNGNVLTRTMQLRMPGSTAASAVVRSALASDTERARSLDGAGAVRRPVRREGAAGCARGGALPGSIASSRLNPDDAAATPGDIRRIKSRRGPACRGHPRLPPPGGGEETPLCSDRQPGCHRGQGRRDACATSDSNGTVPA